MITPDQFDALVPGVEVWVRHGYYGKVIEVGVKHPFTKSPGVILDLKNKKLEPFHLSTRNFSNNN